MLWITCWTDVCGGGFCELDPHDATEGWHGVNGDICWLWGLGRGHPVRTGRPLTRDILLQIDRCQGRSSSSAAEQSLPSAAIIEQKSASWCFCIIVSAPLREFYAGSWQWGRSEFIPVKSVQSKHAKLMTEKLKLTSVFARLSVWSCVDLLPAAQCWFHLRPDGNKHL